MTTGREQKSTIGNFSRGAELWMHQARLIAVAIWTAVFISFLPGGRRSRCGLFLPIIHGG